MTKEAFERVVGIIRQNFSNVDHENLAMDILFESWQNGVENPSWAFIRHRCIDYVRARQREAEARKNKPPYRELTESDERGSDIRTQVDRLMKLLSATERKVIFYRFYLELTLKEISERMNLDINKVRGTLDGAIFKMRDFGNE